MGSVRLAMVANRIVLSLSLSFCPSLPLTHHHCPVSAALVFTEVDSDLLDLLLRHFCFAVSFGFKCWPQHRASNPVFMCQWLTGGFGMFVTHFLYVGYFVVQVLQRNWGHLSQAKGGVFSEGCFKAVCVNKKTSDQIGSLSHNKHLEVTLPAHIKADKHVDTPPHCSAPVLWGRPVSDS